jgi:putative ABC transport system substrate-binding protein
MTTRRGFIGTVAGLALASPFASTGQQTVKLARVGYLAPNLSASPQLPEAFRQGLRELGYFEGRGVVFEYRSADGRIERLPALAAQLVALDLLDVIVTGGGTLAALAAQQATKTLPIVAIAVGDPVASELVASLARPGGNVTGLSVDSPELVGKWLELLKQCVPGAERVAFLWQPDALGERSAMFVRAQASAAAQSLRLQLQFVEARGPSDIDRAFAEITTQRAEAVTVWAGPTFLDERARLTALTARNRLPAMFPFREFADAGGLISYGPSLPELYRRAAGYVDKIIKGAKAGDLPVEQPSRFELTINLKTAATLGLTIPPSLLSRADAVIR